MGRAFSKAVDAHLEVNDRLGVAGGVGHQRGVGNHPRLGVGRYVRQSLKHRSRRQLEGRCEEVVGGFVGGEFIGGSDLTLDHAGVLRTRKVDEANLFNLVWVHRFDESQRGRCLRDLLSAGMDVGQSIAGETVKSLESGIVRRDEGDGPCSFEVLQEPVGAFARFKSEGVIVGGA